MIITQNQVERYRADAIALSSAERWEEARESFIKASLCAEAKDLKNIANDIAICSLNLGLEQEMRGQFQGALESYAEALSNNPDYAKACYARSRLLIRTRSYVSLQDWPARLSEAMALLKKAAIILPTYRMMALNDLEFVPVRHEPEFALALRMLVA